MTKGAVEQVQAAKASLLRALRGEPGLVGVGIASPQPGAFEIVVFVAEEHSAVIVKVPKTWRGYPVRLEVSGVPRRLGQS
jgi:hypothetical protein